MRTLKTLTVLSAISLYLLSTGCSSQPESKTEQEKKVDDMVKSDQEKADSMKKALGIE